MRRPRSRKLFDNTCLTCGARYTSTDSRPRNCLSCGREIAAQKWKDSQVRRLLSLIEEATDDTCVEWPFGKDNHGYGNTMVAGRSTKAHRAIYSLLHGEVPPDIEVMHSCDNRGCINPHHLSLGTHLDNMQDAAAKGRIHALRGTAHLKCRLSEDDVRAIRASVSSNRELARLYGLNHKYVGLIKARLAWRHLP